MKHLIFLLLISLQLQSASAQNKNITNKRIDSLLNKLEQSEDVAKSKIIYAEIQDLASSISDRKNQIKSKRFLARILFNYAKDHTAALELIKELDRNDYAYLAPGDATSIIFTKSLCYKSLKLYDEALQELERMLPYMAKITDNNQYHGLRFNYFSNKADIFNQLNKSQDSIILYSHEAFEAHKKIARNHPYFGATIDAGASLGNLYLLHKQLDSAEKYIDYSYNQLLDPKLSISIAIKGFITRLKGQLLLAQLKYKEAIVFFDKTIELGTQINSLDLKRSSYWYLSESYRGLKDKEKENYYLKSYTDLTDSLNIQTLGQIKKPLMDLSIKKLEAEKSPYKYMWPWGIAIVTITTLIAFLLHKKTLKKQDNLPLSVEKNLVIDEYRTVPIVDIERVIELAKRHDVTFFKNFYELEPAFMHSLLFIAPDLSSSDLEFCAYLRLNFSTKEIARFTNLSIKSIQSKKYRLRKRLNIKTEEDINIWMSTL